MYPDINLFAMYHIIKENQRESFANNVHLLYSYLCISQSREEQSRQDPDH